MPAAAIVGASVIGAGASIAAGSSAAGAQRDAAAQNAALQQQQIAENQRQYNQNRADLAPYRSVGTGALYQLSDLMGIKPAADTTTISGTGSGATGYGNTASTGQDWNAYLTANPDVMQGWQGLSTADKAQFPTPQSYAQFHYNTYGQAEGRAAPPTTTPGTTAGYNSGVASSDFGSLSKPFTLADFIKDPGYDFRQQEGQRGVEASAAARGGVLSGGALKALTKYNQDFASNEYGNAYNRYNQDQTTRFNRLSALAGTGQTATNSGIAAGNTLQDQNQTGINNIASNNNAAANATASQYAGIGNSVSGLANNVGNYFALNNLAGVGGAMSASGNAANSFANSLWKDPSLPSYSLGL